MSNNGKIVLHKIYEQEIPVWKDGEMTDEKETRVCACVKQEYGDELLISRVRMGSLRLKRGVTIEQAQEAYDGKDLSDLLEFGEPEVDSQTGEISTLFFKVNPK